MQLYENLDEAKIKAALSSLSQNQLAHLEILESVDSTNSYLLRMLKERPAFSQVCFAEEQTQGRGRRGKVWFSPKGQNIYCSLSWHFASPQKDISQLSLAVSVMLFRALKRYGIHEGLQFKWPNDLYYANRKLAGVLVESVPAKDGFNLVIGIGLNLINNSSHPYAEKAITIEEIIQDKPNRNQLAGVLLDTLLTELVCYSQEGFQAFLLDWQTNDMLLERPVLLQTEKNEWYGVVKGINAAGELLLANPSGEINAFHSGEISIKLPY